MSYLLLGQKVKRCNVGFLLCVSVNIVILVLAVALFLLVLHHNFLGLSSLLRNEVSGMGTLTKALLPVKDLEFPVSHILSYITRFKEKAFCLALQKLLTTLRKAGCAHCALAACPLLPAGQLFAKHLISPKIPFYQIRILRERSHYTLLSADISVGQGFRR